MSRGQNIRSSPGFFLVYFTRLTINSIINIQEKPHIMHNYLSDCAVDCGKMSKKYFNLSSFMISSSIYSFQKISKNRLFGFY